VGFLLLRSSVIEVATGETTVPFKFSPGHYILLPSTTGSWAIEDDMVVMALYENDPRIKGYVKRIRWRHLETNTQGDYSNGDALLATYLGALGSGQRLVLSVLTQLYGGVPVADAHSLLPTYLDNIDGGPYFYDGTGADWGGAQNIQAHLNTPGGMEAHINLFEHLAGLLDDDDRFEMISKGETAVSTPSALGWSYSDYKNELITNFIPRARTAWTRTPIRIGVNYMQTQAHMQEVIEAMVPYQICGGGPDTLPRSARVIWGNDIYQGRTGSPTKDYRGLIPWISQVDLTEVGGYLGNFTPAQIWGDPDYGHDALRPTHWFWYYNQPGAAPDSTAATQFNSMLAWMESHPLTTENTTNPYGSGVAPPDPDPGGPGPIEYIATGSVVEANYAPVTVAYGATPQAGDLGLIFAFIQTGSAGKTLACNNGFTLLDSFGASSQQPMYVFGKILSAAETGAIITPSGGASGNVVQAFTVLLRNTAGPISSVVHSFAHKSTTGASQTNAILTPALTMTQDDCIAFLAVSFQLDSTGMGTFNPGGAGAWTQRKHQSTTTGNNQSIALYSSLQTTAANIAASTLAVTGQATGVTARTIAISIKASV
jgi:hypothetical protein